MDVLTTRTAAGESIEPHEPLYDFVKRNLSASEFQMYLMSIVGCLASDDPFPIPFDNVAEWLGKSKSNLKRTLLEKLQNSVHYQVL